MEGQVIYEAAKAQGREVDRRGRQGLAEAEEGTIKFTAAVWKVGTLGTGGIRLQLNLDQAYIKEMAMLAECQHELIELEFEAKQA